MPYQPICPAWRLAALSLACFVPLAMSARGDNGKTTASLNGHWVYEKQTIGGWELSQDRLDEIWIEIEGDSFFRCGKGGVRQESRLTLDPTREPKEFVLRFKHPVTGKVSKSKGIYRLAGDRLILCYDNSGKRLPANFESPKGRDEIVLSVLRRSKK